MNHRLTLLAMLLAAFALLSRPVIAQSRGGMQRIRHSKMTSSAAAGSGLHQIFMSKHNKYFGCALDFQTLTGKPAQVAAQQFGFATPANAMKWEYIEPTRGKFDFSKADEFMAFAKQHNMKVRGHTLVWYSQLAPWVKSVSTADDMKQVMQNHISTVMGRYKGQIYAWDVVNEAFESDGSFRQNAFYKALGPDYIPMAFKMAREADPGAKLYINDYSIDNPGSGKTKSLINWVKKWKTAGAPIDGIGSQSHMREYNGLQVGASLEQLCSIVDECAITELDITKTPPAAYVNAFKVCRDVKNCAGVTQWGVSDADSWRKDESPLLFDLNYEPKPAVKAVIASL